MGLKIKKKVEQALDEYFNNTTKEEFKSDLIEAGFNVTDNNIGIYAMPGKPIVVTGENDSDHCYIMEED